MENTVSELIIRWIKWHFELVLTSKFSCITFWLGKISHGLGFFFIKLLSLKGNSWDIHDTLGPQRHCNSCKAECNAQVSKACILRAKSFSKICLDATAGTQDGLHGFCFFLPSCCPYFSHSYSFPAVLYLTRSSPCGGMAALWFMSILSLHCV